LWSAIAGCFLFLFRIGRKHSRIALQAIRFFILLAKLPEKEGNPMRRTFAILLTLAMVLTMAACSAPAASVDVAAAKSIADLKGAKIAAQSGTFHADAMTQIPEVQGQTLPEFSDLLTVLKAGTIDGYVAEEPTAIEVCLSDSTLAYLPLKNNDTGFTATDADVGIAVGLKTGSALRDQINTILAEISAEVRSELMNQMVQLAAGKTVTTLALNSEAPANPVGTLRVGMECAYKPFNWTDMGTPSLGAVPISGEGKDNMYANGYDVQIAQYIANKLGTKLEVYSYEWDGLIPALNSGAVDAIIAGMSPTAEREQEIDFTNVYYSSNLVIIYKKK
jgi:ABC-type amino acid transport substrate-binding protein